MRTTQTRLRLSTHGDSPQVVTVHNGRVLPDDLRVWGLHTLRKSDEKTQRTKQSNAIAYHRSNGETSILAQPVTTQ